MKKLRQWHQSWRLGAGAKGAVLCAVLLVNALAVALAGQLVTRQSVTGALGDLAQPWLWLTVAFLALLAGAVALLSRSVFAACLVVDAAGMVIVFINYFKELITSTPLSFQDFLLAGQVGDIAALNASSLYMSWKSVTAVAGMVVWLAVVFLLSGGVRLKWRWSALWGGCCAVVFALVFVLGAETLVYTPLGAPVSRSLSQTVVNRETGVLLGIWRGLLNSAAPPISGEYSQESMDRVAQEAEALAAGEADTPRAEQPNIILILSESFFDVTTLPGVTYDRDPLAEFHALQAEGVSGSFYTRTVGYGTCNIELEILTGINTALLNGEDLYSLDPQVFTRLSNVPSLLKDSGYYTAMIHMFNDSIYNRTPIFTALGFEELFFTPDFAAIDDEAAAAADYWAALSDKIAGEFYSDAYMTDLLISLYEKKGDEGPVFLYGISMENHTPYTADKYSQEERTVSVTTNLTEEADGMVQAIAQGAADASQALGALTDYFRTQDEPTVIVFYGDHRPGLGLTNGGTVYSQLGMCAPQRSDWSLEEIKELYATSYLIWSNDPAYLPGQPGDRVDKSSNYLGVDLLNAAGVDKPTYWGLLENLSHTRLSDTWAYSLGQDGAMAETLPDTGEDADKLSLLRSLLEDAVYGRQYVTQRVNGPPS